jgi:hypothetical protein
MPSDPFDHARALERDSLKFTTDFSLFVLRSCIVLHGGAILALLSLLGTIITHTPAAPTVISVGAVRIAIGEFALGLILTISAGICGYFNFLAGQARDVPAQQLLSNRSRIWATGFGIASLVMFVFGVATVVIPWR